MQSGICQLGLSAVAAIGALLLLPSCSSTRSVDYADYERIPITTSSLAFRALAKTNPVTAEMAFYGNYGGPGNDGGKPIDKMDELFRRHDIVYYASKTKKTMRVADQELVARLRDLSPEEMDKRGQRYRTRVINFCTSPWCGVIGKPWSTFHRCRESAACYFQSPEIVRAFFRPDHPGIPTATRNKP